MQATETLSDLPLASLFSAPLVAAVEANVQAQRESLRLLREIGFEGGSLRTVSFSYTTTGIDSETGAESRIQKELEIPVVLFLSFPELVVHEVEQTFSARITGERTEESEENGNGDGGSGGAAPFLPSPTRLQVAPSSESATFSERTKSKYDLDIRMVAEVDTQTAGMETLERAANSAVATTDEGVVSDAEGETE